MFELPVKEIRKPRSFTLKPSTVARVEELAVLHDTSASRIIEALIIQFSPKLLEQARARQEQASA